MFFPTLYYPRTISANSSFLSQLNIEPWARKSATLLPYLLLLRIGAEWKYFFSLKLAGTATRQSVRDDSLGAFLCSLFHSLFFLWYSQYLEWFYRVKSSTFLIIHDPRRACVLLYLKDEKGVGLNLNITFLLFLLMLKKGNKTFYQVTSCTSLA